MNGRRRDGHLTDLALEYALDGNPLPDTAEHLASCAVCQARLEAADAVALPELPALQLPSQPLPASPAQTPEPANRPWMWATVAVVAAAAVLIAIPAVNTAVDPGDGIRVKGTGLAMQVYRDEGATSPRLRDGDEIAPGDRLGFRIRNRDSGWLMIVGIDAADAPYLCYPQNGGGKAIEIESNERPRSLPEAIRMDDTPGSEQLVAVLCDTPYTYDTMVDALFDDAVPEGCSVDTLTLEKP